MPQDAAKSVVASDMAVRGSVLSALGDEELRRWQERCMALEVGDDVTWPADKARALVDSIHRLLFVTMPDSAERDESKLAVTAREWAKSNPSMAVLVRRLGCLRELFAEEGVIKGPELAGKLQLALDKVTTVATEEALSELQDAALTDALTGVGNRRALASSARTALAAASRGGQALSVAIIDLDGLKTINDTEGHAAGDRAIAGLTAALRAALRDTDQLFRVGGDEFVALLPMAPAHAVADLMGRAEHFDSPRFSWGVACAPDDGTDLQTLLKVADERLYECRRNDGYSNGRTDKVAAAEPGALRHAAPSSQVAPSSIVPPARHVPSKFAWRWPAHSATPSSTSVSLLRRLLPTARSRQVASVVLAAVLLAGSIAIAVTLWPSSSTSKLHPSAPNVASTGASSGVTAPTQGANPASGGGSSAPSAGNVSSSGGGTSGSSYPPGGSRTGTGAGTSGGSGTRSGSSPGETGGTTSGGSSPSTGGATGSGSQNGSGNSAGTQSNGGSPVTVPGGASSPLTVPQATAPTSP